MSFKERYLRGDCSIDMINDYVEMWHGEGEIKKTLSEFLGLSQEEYVCWMISSDEELARMLSRSLPNRDLPYCARHIGWKELKEQLEQAVQTLLSPDYHIAVQPTNGSHWQLQLTLPADMEYQQSEQICKALELRRLDEEHFLTFETVTNDYLNHLLGRMTGHIVISNHADESGVWLLCESNRALHEPQVIAMLDAFEKRLRMEIRSKHSSMVNADTACHQLYGFKVALEQLGLLPESKCFVYPYHFKEKEADNHG